jgi:hypothetical protein
LHLVKARLGERLIQASANVVAEVEAAPKRYGDAEHIDRDDRAGDTASVGQICR